MIGIPLLVWLALTGLAAWIGRARWGRPACAMLALSGAYLPAMLLVGAAIKPSQTVEALIVLLGSPALAFVTLKLVRGYAALAVACAITVGAHAIDMFFGSPLTSLSVLGPNPAGGVRFYGIGNELEAGIAAMVPLGVGAWLGSRPGRSPRFAAVMFFVFAAARRRRVRPGALRRRRRRRDRAAGRGARRRRGRAEAAPARNADRARRRRGRRRRWPSSSPIR